MCASMFYTQADKNILGCFSVDIRATRCVIETMRPRTHTQTQTHTHLRPAGAVSRSWADARMQRHRDTGGTPNSIRVLWRKHIGLFSGATVGGKGLRMPLGAVEWDDPADRRDLFVHFCKPQISTFWSKNTFYISISSYVLINRVCFNCSCSVGYWA